MVHHHKLEYPVKNWIAVLKVKVITKDQNVNERLSGYLLNHQTFCYQTWYDAASLSQSNIWKNWFAIFMVKVLLNH